MIGQNTFYPWGEVCYPMDKMAFSTDSQIKNRLTPKTAIMKKHLITLCCLAVATAATASGAEVSVKNAITGKYLHSMECGDTLSQFEYSDGSRLKSVTKTALHNNEITTYTFDYTSPKFDGSGHDVLMTYTEGQRVTDICIKVDERGFATYAYARNPTKTIRM